LAKKKTRTPPPPRRVQAPTRRAPVSAETERRTKLVLYGLAALGFIGLAAAIALFTASGSGGEPKSVASVIRQAGCRIQEPQASAAGIHVTSPPPKSDYNTWPPTSGPHNPQWAPYDVYTEPVEEYRLVHNLEHGGIVIQYGNKVSQAEVDQIVDWYRDDPNGLVVAPLPSLGKTIAMTAWTQPEDGSRGTGHLMRCDAFVQRAFDAFKTTYAFRGPERFPPELLAPGS